MKEKIGRWTVLKITWPGAGGTFGQTRGTNPFTQTTRGNLVHKHKTIKFYLMVERPFQNISKSAEQTEKSRKIPSNQITTVHLLRSFPNGIARNI